MLNAPGAEVLSFGHQRSRGSASMTVKRRRDRNRLDDLYQQGCAKLRLPRTPRAFIGENAEVVMINTSGGITGGDELYWQFGVQQYAGLTVTSQACERLYRSTGETAKIGVDLTVERGGTMYWVPQETILFDGSRTHRRINVNLAANGRALLVEPLIFGRKAMGEVVSHAVFRDDWSVFHDGNLVHREVSQFDGEIPNALNQAAVTDGHTAIATILLLAPAGESDLELKLERLRKLFPSSAAASLWQVGETGKLLARIVSEDAYELRKTLIPVMDLLTDDAALPKTWPI